MIAVVLAAREARERRSRARRSRSRPIMPADAAARRAPSGRRRAARAVLHEGGAEPREQPGRGADEVAEQRQPGDQHERSRREHQAHVEVSEEDHVSFATRGPAAAERPEAPSAARRRRPGLQRAAEAHATRALRRALRERRARGHAIAAPRARAGRAGARAAHRGEGARGPAGRRPGRRAGRRVGSSLASKSGM